MKNTLFSITLLLISQLSYSQVDSLTVEWDTSTVSQRIVLDSIFENLNLSSMQTDYLLDYGAIINEPSKYNGTVLDSTNLARPLDVQGVYYTIDFAATTPFASWAVGVAYYFTRQIYPTDVWDWQDLMLDNHWNGRDMVNWGERRYTPFVIDVIDNENQRVDNGGDPRFPVDRCTEFTLAEVEDQLEQRRTLNAWRDGLKSYRRINDNLLDELTANYTAIQ